MNSYKLGIIIFAVLFAAISFFQLPKSTDSYDLEARFIGPASRYWQEKLREERLKEQQERIDRIKDATVPVFGGLGNGKFDGGTGTIVGYEDGKMIIIASAHVTVDPKSGKPRTVLVRVYDKDGKLIGTFPAKVILHPNYEDNPVLYDAVRLEVDVGDDFKGPSPIKPGDISFVAPKPSEPIKTIGFPDLPKPDKKVFEGKVAEGFKAGEEKFVRVECRKEDLPPDGVSGGPVIVCSEKGTGRIVAILQGTELTADKPTTSNIPAEILKPLLPLPFRK